MNPSFNPETFIRSTTDQVWNRKNVGELYQRAVANVTMHGPSGREGYGREAMMTDVITWLAAFPDTQVEIEDVIWDGDDENGYQISVQRTLAGRNLNPSVYGPATGAEVSVRSLTQYNVFDGMIREVWHEFDEAGLIRQLGFDLFEAIKRVEQQQPAVEPATDVVGEIERTTGQLPPAVLPAPPTGFDPTEFVRRALHEIWNWRLVGKVDDYYAENFTAHLSGRQMTGREGVSASVLVQLAAFPDLSFHPDQIIAVGDGRSGYRVATRWTMLGTHLGPSDFGPLTGKRVRLNGISHHRIWRSQFVEEWTEVGEFGLLREIAERPSVVVDEIDQAENAQTEINS